jgi:hypothetical protein
MTERVAAFFVPVLLAVALLYQVFADLQIAMSQPASLWIIGLTLAAAAVAGTLAFIGPVVVRVGVLTASALVFLDVTLHLSGLFERLTPEIRVLVSRDEQRITALHQIKAALEADIAGFGALPAAEQYGEGTGPAEFWRNWWDVSAADGDRDGHPFLDFLVDDGIVSAVPVDPVNRPAPDDDPRGGQQFVYLLVPPGYEYAGGTCDPGPNRWIYLLGITDLEYEDHRPPARFTGSGCACLWRDQPDYFQHHFDYVLCGGFDASPDTRSQAVSKRAAARAARADAEARVHAPHDARRIADLRRIQEALTRYAENVGRLPRPSEYGEAEASSAPGFWQHMWDVSAEDGDRDGVPFLDFLVESGTMDPVPVDPDNEPSATGDPRDGRQFVYFVVPPDYQFEGGSCAAAENEWTYLLGITDLRSESRRPPRGIGGSGCECLWRNQPNYFQAHFDYVLCGTFRRAGAD